MTRQCWAWVTTTTEGNMNLVGLVDHLTREHYPMVSFRREVIDTPEARHCAIEHALLTGQPVYMLHFDFVALLETIEPGDYCTYTKGAPVTAGGLG